MGSQSVKKNHPKKQIKGMGGLEKQLFPVHNETLEVVATILKMVVLFGR